MRQKINNNKRYKCVVPGCQNNRHRLTQYCSAHEQRYMAYGHPLARSLKPRDYAHELQEVTNLIQHNVHHEGIQEAVRFLDNVLKTTRDDKVSLLYDKGLRGEEILCHVAAIYQLQRGNSGFIKSDQHFVKAIGGRVLILRSQEGERISGKERQALGQFLIDNLGLICLNICRALEELEAKQKERYFKFTQPLSIN